MPKYRFKGQATLILDSDNHARDNQTFVRFEIKKMLPFQPMADYDYSFFHILREVKENRYLEWDDDTQSFTHGRYYA